MAPWFVLVAGINGAGKSTLSQSQAFLGGLAEELATDVEVINPDLVTRELMGADPQLDLARANVAAAESCERRLATVLREGKTSVAIETVLSTDKYKPVFERAQRRGYNTLFVYILLDSIEQAIERVRHRVEHGGHDVKPEKIQKRWPLSLANLPWFWARATRAFIFFNGTRTPVLLAERTGSQHRFYPQALAAVWGASPARSAVGREVAIP